MRWLLLVLALLMAVPVCAAPTQQEVEESLTCQCGCGLTVHSCNHIQCGSGEPMKKEIAERLAQGETKEQILAAFTQRLGEKVLSSPTMQGFNRLAWVTPFAALLVAGTILTVAIRRRARLSGAALAPPRATPAATDPLRARLARELEALDRKP
ncbi:MAG: cytochrome c-type biogenesis protein [Candidatus Binatia bacterium]